MGYLLYGDNEYHFDDRVLSHLKLAVGQKLSHQECFFLSWIKPTEEGGGRMSIWMSPYATLEFRFSGSRPPEINEAWVKAMIALANTPRGLLVISEEDAARLA